MERKEAGLVPGTFLSILKDKSNNAFKASDDAKESEMCVGGEMTVFPEGGEVEWGSSKT